MIFGLLPHSFCIAFIVFTALGTTIAAGFIKQLLVIPYFFQALVGLSIVFATISAIIYLKKSDLLSLEGIKLKWQYLSILYLTTIIVNLVFLQFIFPTFLTKNSSTVLSQSANLQTVTLKVNIPCSGHAPLILDEAKKIAGVADITYQAPDLFTVAYDPKIISIQQLLTNQIFQSFKAEVNY